MTVAAILAGGLGTRLRPALGALPKVLAPVSGRPFVTRLLAQAQAAGASEIVLLTGHGADDVESAVRAAWSGVPVTFSRETTPLGTAGALRNGFGLLPSEPVLVLNGDSFCAADLGAFLDAHRASGAPASLLLARVDDVSRYGSVAIDAESRVTSFVEKGTRGGAGWINAGVYALSRTVLEALPPGPSSLEREVFPALVGRGLRGWPHGGRFLDIGTPESFAAAEEFFARRFVLLDRDGTINVDKGYVSDPADVELIPGALEALRLLRSLGLGLAVVTNQSGIGRGYLDEEKLSRIHARLGELLAEGGVELDGIYFCPHHPDERCDCRKPATRLAERAAAELGFDPSRGFMVGDKAADVDLGRALGAVPILVRTGYGSGMGPEVEARAAHVEDDLLGAARRIAERIRASSPRTR